MLETDTADSLYKDGRQAAAEGRLQDALAALSHALAIDPARADIHYEQGNVLRRLDRAHAAETALRAALRLDPRLSDASFSLTFLLRDQGRMREIEECLVALADAVPDDAERIEQAAGLLTDYGCFPQALALFRRAARLKPALPRLSLQIGQLEQKLGRFSDAHAAFMQAIHQDSLSGPAYLLLAHNGRAEDGSDERLGLCTRALDLPALPENTRICLHFACGKLLDDLGNYDRAFDQFRSGNLLRRAQVGFDRSIWSRYFLDLQKIPAPQSENKPETGSSAPVFIVGMPRSGTTLIHRLLSNHPAVYGLGETEMVDQLVETLARHTETDYPACLSGLKATDFRLLARQYQARWPRAASKARYVLDKNPLNFMHIGLIARLFPEARFIHCLRDPRDVALSVYFQNFAHPRNAYAYDLEDIGHFFSGYQSLMAHWQSEFTSRLHTLCYERVVTDPENEIRKLLTALGLEWNEACIAPETGDQEISTASVWQARQPLYSDSIGRWQHYQNQLKPFMDAVPPAALQYQY